MSNIDPQETMPKAAPAGWYPISDITEKFWNGDQWVNGTEQPIQAKPVSIQEHVAVKQSRDKAQYVRQQKGHSLLLHLFIIGPFTLWIPAIYYSVSPNHFWHA